MKLTPDELQNELLLLSHHIEDAEEALGALGWADFEVRYVKASLKDMKESLRRLAKKLPNGYRKAIRI